MTLPVSLFHERIRRIQTLLAKGDKNALLIVCQDGVGWQDLYYLTGFLGTSGVLVVETGGSVLFVDPRYHSLARETSGSRVICCSEVKRGSPLQAAVMHLDRLNPAKVVAGSRKMSHVSYRYILENLRGCAELPDWSAVLANLRRRKTDEEMSCIRRAVSIASRSFMETLSEACCGMSERAFASKLEGRLYEYGADFIDPVPVMVSSGDRTALPHAFPSDRTFRQGDLVMVDFGVRCGGYVCDITRMFSVGALSENTGSLYSLLLWAQSEAASRLKPGVSVKDIDAAARSVIDNAGLGGSFTHGIGHGIGLDIHEFPSLNASGKTNLAEGDVLTLEPGFYKPGWGGMRIEDDYLIRPTGCECLTRGLSNELFVV